MTEKQRIKNCIRFKDAAAGIHQYRALDDFFGNHIAYVRNRGVSSVQEVGPGMSRDEWDVVWDRRMDKDIGDPERYARILPTVEANPASWQGFLTVFLKGPGR